MKDKEKDDRIHRKLLNKLKGELGSAASPASNKINTLAAASNTPIAEIREIIVGNGYPKEMITDENVIVAYNCNFASQDLVKAVMLLQVFIDSAQGKIEPIVEYMSNLLTSVEEPVLNRLLGADNRNGVTCYLDSLMFCLFARQADFEPMLSRRFPQNPELDTLATLLRLYVNLLRRGKHITTDITKVLIQAIIKAGWEPSAAVCQQDTCELFNFITDKLSMPMLTLKLEIAHEGLDSKEDDHKFVNERMLLVTIPGHSGDSPITLEECMENYFQNSVQVYRQLARRKTLDSIGSMSAPSTRKRQLSIRVSNRDPHDHERDTDKGASDSHGVPLSIRALVNSHLSNIKTDSSSTTSQRSNNPPMLTPTTSDTFKGLLEYDLSSNSKESSGKSTASTDSNDTLGTQTVTEESSATSVSDVVPFPNITEAPQVHSGSHSPLSSGVDTGDLLPSYNSLYDGSSPAPFTLPEKPALSTLPPNNLWTPNKEFSLPAWMFLQIVPFYTNPKAVEAPSNPQEILSATESFVGARPVVAMCLKRSTWDSEGQPVLNSRKVLVPPVIHFPTFVADDDDEFGEIDRNNYAIPNKQSHENYILVLEGAIFHRGSSTTSGHFVSMIRERTDIKYADDVEQEASSMGATVVTSPVHTSSSSAQTTELEPPRYEDPAPPYSERERKASLVSSVSEDASPIARSSRWLFFDDLLPSGKQVQEAKYQEVFERESPYVLFYRLVTVDDYAREQSPINTPYIVSSNAASEISSKIDINNPSTSALSMMDDPDPQLSSFPERSGSRRFPRNFKYKSMISTSPPLASTSTPDISRPPSIPSDPLPQSDSTDQQADSHSVFTISDAIASIGSSPHTNKPVQFLDVPGFKKGPSIPEESSGLEFFLPTSNASDRPKRSKSRYSNWASSLKRSISRDVSPVRESHEESHERIVRARSVSPSKTSRRSYESSRGAASSSSSTRNSIAPSSVIGPDESTVQLSNNIETPALSSAEIEDLQNDLNSLSLAVPISEPLDKVDKEKKVRSTFGMGLRKPSRLSTEDVRPEDAAGSTVLPSEGPDWQAEPEPELEPPAPQPSHIPHTQPQTEKSYNKPEKEKKPRSLPFRRSKGKTADDHHHHHHHRHHRSLSPEEANAQKYRQENCTIM